MARKKIDDHPSPVAKQLISDLSGVRESILTECINDATILVRWLYENQGVRRFDASNRLFLVLVDKSNFFESWKLKRAKPLISATVNSYLDNTSNNPGFSLQFTWEGKIYQTVSDAVFVIK